MKVLFILNFPSPYRVDFLNELALRLIIVMALVSHFLKTKHVGYLLIINLQLNHQLQI